MYNISAKIVQKASATVQSTVSTVASVAGVGGSKRADRQSSEMDSHDILQNSKEKLNLQIKCTPSKDAATSRALSVKSGFLRKKNEQGVWQNRFICMVPHTFLYYYDSETAESPRGVIDLELFNNLSVEGNDCNILRLGTFDETALRSFYFQVDDPNVLSEWMTTLHQERFNVVRDERDAYMQLQVQFSGEINSASKLVESNAQDKERLQQELQKSQQTTEECLQALKRVLLRFGLSDTEMMKYDSPSKISDSIQQNIDKVYESHDVLVKELYARQSEDRKSLEERIEELKAQVAQATESIGKTEAAMSQQQSEFEQKFREKLGEIDIASLNTQMAVAAKEGAEAKCATLTEQKKVLVKEVKHLRTKLDESSESINVLQQNNDKLAQAVMALQEKLTLVSTELAAANNHITSLQSNSHSSSNNTNNTNKDKEPGEPGSPVSSATGNETPVDGQGTPQARHSDFIGIDPREIMSGISELLHESAMRRPSTASNASGSSGALTSSAMAGSPTQSSTNGLTTATTSNTNNNNNNNTTSASTLSSSATSFSTLSYLFGDSSSAANSAKKPEVEEHNDQDGNDDERPSFELNHHTLRELGRSKNESKTPTEHLHSEDSNGNNESHSLDNKLSSYFSTHGTENKASRRSSMEMLTSMFHFDKSNTTPAIEKEENELPPTTAKANNDTNNFFASACDDHNESQSNSTGGMKLRCLRCNGTIEGPKYSTCKCAVPAMSLEDLDTPQPTSNSGGGLISSIFRGGSAAAAAAGGLAGGFFRATTTVAATTPTTSTSNTSGNGSSHGNSNGSGANTPTSSSSNNNNNNNANVGADDSQSF